MDPLAPQIQVALPGIPQVGDIIAEKYRVEAILGVGGMGVVLSARHLKLGQVVAIKVLTVREDQQKDSVERFLREGRTAAGLVSDHVVRIYDVGQLDNGTPFMVMERLRGQDLAAVLVERGPLPVEEAVEYIAQATMAIAEAHEAGVVHRDLKPSNLFLTQRSDGAACIKVLDFGISKQLSMFESQTMRGDLTQTRQVMGSPAYMSPEQVRDARNVDHRTDVWALGTTLYELLTRHVAFDADTLPAVCAAIAADPPTPIEAHRSDVPGTVADIVMRCLEKTPDKRYQSARALLSALRVFQGRPDRLVSAQNLEEAPRTAASVPSPKPSEPSIPRNRSIQQSGTRSVEPIPVSEGNDSTLLSGRVATKAHDSSVDAPKEGTTVEADPSPSKEKSSEISPKTVASRRTQGRRIGYLAVAVLGLVGAVTAGSIFHQSKTKPTSSVTQEASIFQLRIESEPPQAAVFEGERKLGETPLMLRIEKASVAFAPRRFTLRKDGYLDTQLDQSDSSTDRQVTVALRTLSVTPVTPVGSVSAEPSSENPEKTPPQGTGPTRSAPRATEVKSDSSGLRSRSATSRGHGTTATTPPPHPADIRIER
jgi:serine/threonine-protein kinase